MYNTDKDFTIFYFQAISAQGPRNTTLTNTKILQFWNDRYIYTNVHN